MVSGTFAVPSTSPTSPSSPSSPAGQQTYSLNSKHRTTLAGRCEADNQPGLLVDWVVRASCTAVGPADEPGRLRGFCLLRDTQPRVEQPLPFFATWDVVAVRTTRAL